MGDSYAGPDVGFLRSKGITHIINCAYECEYAPRKHDGTEYMHIRAEDGPNERLRPYFSPTYHFIEAALSAGGKVLIYSYKGKSRSATITMAYLMRKRGMTTVEAYKYLKSKRSDVSPIATFKKELEDFERYLRGNTARVQSANSHTWETGLRQLFRFWEINPTRLYRQDSHSHLVWERFAEAFPERTLSAQEQRGVDAILQEILRGIMRRIERLERVDSRIPGPESPFKEAATVLAMAYMYISHLSRKEFTAHVRAVLMDPESFSREETRFGYRRYEKAEWVEEWIGQTKERIKEWEAEMEKPRHERRAPYWAMRKVEFWGPTQE